VIWSLLQIPNILAAFIGTRESATVAAAFWKWVSMEHRWFLALNLLSTKWRFIADILKWVPGCLQGQQPKRQASGRILKTRVNEASTIFDSVTGVIYVSLCGNISYMKSWWPFQAKQCMTPTLPHQENECQQSVNNFWLCILGNQGIMRIFELITELLNAFIGKNAKY